MFLNRMRMGFAGFFFFSFWMIALAIRQSKGHYHPYFVPLVLLIILYLSWRFFQFEVIPEFKKTKNAWNLPFLFYLSFSYFLLDDPIIFYSENQEALLILRLCLGAHAILATVAFIRFHQKKKFQSILGFNLVFLSMMRFLIPVIAPQPFIDVFHITTNAANDFLRGVNPYQQMYQDIYQGEYFYEPVFCYWPGILYGAAFFKKTLGDIRYLYVFADILAAFVLWRISPKNLLWALLWLTIPVGFFTVDQAWVDGLLPPFVFLAGFGILKKNWKWTAVGIGVLCSIKQYAILPAFLSVIVIYRLLGFRAAVKMTLLSSAITLSLLLPMALLDFKTFYERTLAFFANQPMRPDAFTIIAWIDHLFGVVVSGKMTLIPIAIALVFSVKVTLQALKKNDSLMALWLWAGGQMVINGVFFIFAKQAFCNYYHYLLTFGLLGLMVISEKSDRNI